jgi:hypothetical protein
MVRSGSKPNVAKNPKEAVAEVWRAVGRNVGDAYQLSLRDAANIVGFHTFPVGWSWIEYRLRPRAQARPYEETAANAARLGIPNNADQEPGGATAADISRQFRRRRTETLLHQIISRRRVELLLFNAEGRGHFASDAEILDFTLRLNIERGGVTIRDHNFEARLDGISLLDHLGPPDTLRKGKHDWLLAERLLRDFVTTHGCASPAEHIMKICADTYSTIRPSLGVLNKTSYSELARLIKEEHQDSAE